MAALASVSLDQIASASSTAAGAFFSGLSEAYRELQERWAQGVTSEAQRVTDIIEANRRAYEEAASWARAFSQGAIQAGDTGIGRIMEKWADIYESRAADIRVPANDAAAAYAESIGRWQRDLDNFARQVPNFGTDFARNIGPIVDAYGLGQGIIDLINSGDISGYEKAAWGVALAEGFAGAAIVGAGIIGVTGAVPLAIAAGIGAVIGSAVGSTWGTEISNTIRDAIPTSLWDMYFDTGTAVSRSIPPEVWDFIFGIPNRIGDIVNSVFGTATTPIRRDPLAIDLDGDGIETVGIGSTPILFDHNADGVRTGTGWLAPDDAWLALDRDGNGSIDSGRELFGVDTQITVTETVNGVATTITRNATTGFEALRALDANGDNVFDAQDAAFAQLRLWRDLNQDGVSQAGELSTLADHGIVSIGLTPTSTTTNLGNGNTITGTATVTTSSGTTTEVDSVDLTAGNLNLADNPFYRDFTDSVSPTETAQSLPDMGGSGVLRDLREAMSLSTAQGGALAAAVQAFAGASTRDAQVAQLDALLAAWAGTAAPVASNAAGLPGQVERLAIAGSSGVNFSAFGAVFGAALDARGVAWREVSGSTAEQVQALGQMVQDAGLVRGWGIKQSGSSYSLDYWNQSALAAFAYSQPALAGRIAVLEQFNGAQAYAAFTARVSTGAAMDGYRITVPQGNADLFNQAYEALRESVYGSLVVQTRLQPYLEGIQLVVEDEGIRLDSSALADQVEAGHAASNREVLIDLIELNRYSQNVLRAGGYDGLGTLRNWMAELAADSPLHATLAELHVSTLASGSGSAASDIIFGTAAANAISAGTGNDIVAGDAGNDNLYGGNGNDMLDGGEGNDYLSGDAGADLLVGGSGNDNLLGGDGADTLEGGTGTDGSYDYSSTSNDVYRHNLGDGADSMGDYGGTDTVQLGEGIDPAATIVRSNSSGALVLTFADGGSLTLNWQHNSTTGAGQPTYQIEQVVFADGTVWNQAQMRSLAVVGTAGADAMYGFDGADLITGAAGADTLVGRDGDDTLDGGDGNDYLYGQLGNDSLLGGAGSDVLYGNAGNDTYDSGAGSDSMSDDSATSNDTYHYNLGDGADNISDYGGTDTVVLGEGITATNTVVRCNSSGYLVLGFADGGSLTLNFQYNGTTGAAQPTYQLEQIVFADGTTWDQAQMRALALVGGAGADSLYGFDSADLITGAAGADSLVGRDGDDTLDGGEGNDYLYGQIGNDSLLGGSGSDVLYGNAGNDTYDSGAGSDSMSDDSATSNDTYRYNLGDGADNISDYGGTDTVVLGAGITADNTVVRCNSSGYLVLGFADGGSLTLNFQYHGTTGAAQPTYQLEQIVFADGTTWDQAQMRALAITGGAGADSLYGFDSADLITGAAGADSLVGRDGDDSLDGGEGNDYLYGQVGNDSLLGGAGNDVLYGNAGNDTYDSGAGSDSMSDDSATSNDTYRYNLGDGADNISDYGGTDTVVLGAGITTANTVVRCNSSGYLVLGFADGGTLTLNSQYHGTTGAAQATYQLEQIVFADGTVWDQAQLRAQAITGGSAADTLYGFDSADTITGAAGADSLMGRNGDDSLDGGEGNDSLYGETGSDSLLGGAGSDYLSGGEGSDTYASGTGADSLYDSSSSSNDTYRYNLGDGADNISDYGGTDTVQLGAGITAATTAVRRDNSGNLVLTFSDGGSLTLNWQYNGNTGVGQPIYQLEQVVFADGTVWDQTQLSALALTGTAAGESIFGFGSDDVISGGAGNDALYGRDGNDVLDGGADNDSLYGESGNDTLLGGAGNDVLYGNAGNDTYDSGAGSDSMSDDSATSNDNYHYNLGDGADTLSDSGGTDTVVLGAGITAANTVVRCNSSGYLVLGFADGGSLTLNSQYQGTTGAAQTTYQLEQIVFADGTTWDQAQMRALALAGGTGADTLYGFNSADLITGAAGADSLMGRDGDDTLDGGEGSDYLYGQAGNDSLLGGAGNDVLYGNAGNDTYDSGAGSDSMSDDSATSSDTYRYNLGDGADTISDSGGTDTVVLGAGITTDNTVVRCNSSGHLVLVFADGGSLTLNSQYHSTTGAAQPTYQLEQIVFADGTTWDQAQMRALALAGGAGADTLYGFDSADLITGAAGADSLMGRDGDDSLDGGEGNDYLYGQLGNDSLLGGAGNDVLYGNAGNDTYDSGTGSDSMSDDSATSNDTYRYSLGDGADNISDSGGTDTVVLGEGITAANTVVRCNASGYLVLSFADGGSLTLNSQYHSATGAAQPAYQLEQIVFADGTTWDQAQMRALAVVGTAAADTMYGFDGADLITGAAGADSLVGRDGDDSLDGGEGNDYLYGQAGNDSLLGGAGSDVLYGNAGNDTYDSGAGSDSMSDDSATSNDTYRYNLGDGADNISDYGGADTVQLGAGITAAGTTVRSNSSGYLVLGFADGGSLTLNSQHNATTGAAQATYLIEQIVFTDGTVWDQAQLRALAVTGSAAADTLYGFDGADLIIGAAGADSLMGRDGDDSLEGGESNDYLYGQAGNDSLLGGAGSDVLYGNAGNDIYDSGAGSDSMSDDSATSNDTYRYNLGDGVDNISDYGGTDTVQLGTGIATTTTAVRRDSSGNLVLSFSDSGSLTLNWQYNSSTGAAQPAYQIEQVVFADGTVWDQAQLRALALGGGSGADTLYGFDSADAMTGAAGNDTLAGSGGNDSLDGGEGADYLYGGTGNDTATGGAGNDVLYGEAGADVLAGDAGADTLSGGDSDDVLDGGADNDSLSGDAGADTLSGGAGTDTLYGGTGNDIYLFAPGTGADTLSDYDTTSGNTDLLSFGSGITAEQLWFRQVGTSLEVSLIGTTDKATISNWYSGSAYHIEQFRTADGRMLLDSQVQALVSAMAAFTPPAQGQTSLPDAYQTALAPVIAANWQ